MNISICIPTHHGRSLLLAELIESIIGQITPEIQSQLEICISDNGSTDGTELLIAEFIKTSPVPIKYFRYPTNKGIQNFVNVIEMAESDYCWLVGSDDVILNGALARVLNLLKENPAVGGLTVNKLNFDSSLKVYVGPDPLMVLPVDSSESHKYDNFDDIMYNVGILFTYMSAHIFRREGWIDSLKIHGFDYFSSFRHFSHMFLISEIAKKYKTWVWVSDYCVIQRLDNFSVMQDRNNRSDVYSSEVTEDIEKVLSSLLDKKSKEYKKLINHLFLIYWNPISVIKYKSYNNITRDEDKAMLERCREWFGNIPLFFITSYPILLIPSYFIRPKRLINFIFKNLSSQTKGLQLTLRKLMCLLNVESEFTKRLDHAQVSADQYSSRKIK